MTNAHARALFRERFGTEPSIIASAPGRVNLIGEHTDYNGGEVLPIAIARRTVVALGPAGASAPESIAVSASEGETGTFVAARPMRAGRWWDYVAGVAAALRARGITVPEVQLAVWSDVPAGAGLSSSAALEMASALALLAAAERELPAREMALLGSRVETEYVGVATGIMDQFASALGRAGHALHLRCDSTQVEQVPMGDAVLIFDTGVARGLRDSAFNERRAECEAALAALRMGDPGLPHLAAATPEQVHDARLPAPLDRRARHVVTETRRVREAVDALRRDGALPGALLLASHESLRRDYECSSAELDWFVERAMACEGVAGARLTGAGWGGCAIAVGEEEALAAAAERLVAEYGGRFERAGRAWVTRAAGGAAVEERAGS